MNESNIILSTAYFGPIQYFFRFTQNQKVLIEQFDSYSKQTYRNRCVIASSAGTLLLSIPIKQNRNNKTLVKDVRIDYDTNWQKIHLRGIISCYNASPFFEFLRDEIEPFYKKKYDFLIDLNMESTLVILDLLGLENKPLLTTGYYTYKNIPDIQDMRDIISPKKRWMEDNNFSPRAYHQNYIDKLGFLPNLSILDLLFNTGSEAVRILRSCNG